MSVFTKIQWCDSTENPVMGCEGCPLFPTPTLVRGKLVEYVTEHAGHPARASQWVSDEVKARSLTELYQSRHQIADGIAAKFSSERDHRKALAGVIASQVHCYAATLHLMRGRHVLHPGRKGHKGYAPFFENVKLFPNRMAKTARLKPLTGCTRPEKPWLNGLPRTVFVSDMGDALSSQVPFEYLQEEIVDVAQSEEGRQHLWLWLSKRPARMAAFGKWLKQQKRAWPANLVAMTSVLNAKMAGSAINHLRKVPARIRGLSVEPLLEPVTLDLAGIDWVIVGGESGHYARPFDLSWARSIRDQCQQRGVAFFMKQLGANPLLNGRKLELVDPHGGDWKEWPKDLRVRQMPEAFRQTPRS